MTFHYVGMRRDDGHAASGSGPLWARIAERLRDDIKAGTFRPGDLLPGEAELNRRFKVSRTTSRAALDSLEAEGLIARKAGRGSTVLKTRIERPLNRLSSFSEDMRARDLVPSYETLSVRSAEANETIAAELRIEQGSEVFEIDRLLIANGTRIATSLSFIAPFVFAKTGVPAKAVLDTDSLYRWLAEEAGVRLAGGRERIEGALADPVTARRLKLRQPAPILVCRRTSWDDKARPIEHVVLHYSADRYSFQVELTRS